MNRIMLIIAVFFMTISLSWAVVYTHNFEIDLNGINIQGELNFDEGDEVFIKFTSSPMELKLSEMKSLVAFFQRAKALYSMNDKIDKIEIAVK